MTAGPVAKFVDRPPTESATVLWAGQNRSGTHCTTSLSSHSNLPVIADADLMSMARSAARVSATGALKDTTTGCPTPTTSPRVGSTEAMAGLYDWFAATAGLYDWFAAAVLAPVGPAATIALVPIAARTHRTTPRMLPIPSKLQQCQYDPRSAGTNRCGGAP